MLTRSSEKTKPVTKTLQSPDTRNTVWNVFRNAQLKDKKNQTTSQDLPVLWFTMPYLMFCVLLSYDVSILFSWRFLIKKRCQDSMRKTSGRIAKKNTYLRHNHTECQAVASVAAAASPMQVYGDTSLDAPNRPQTHSQILTLTLTLLLDTPLDARCGYALNVSITNLWRRIEFEKYITSNYQLWIWIFERVLVNRL